MAAFADANAGELKIVTVTGLVLSGADAGNYSVNNSAETTATVSPAPLTVSADDNFKNEGDLDPELTYTVAGELYGTDVVTGDLEREAGETPGSYLINQGSVSAGSNYQIAFFEGMFYINPFGPGTKKVRAYLDCVERVPGKGSQYGFIANFRYENTNNFAVYVPFGEDNYLVSETGIYDGSELPELFVPGGGTFQVPFDGERLIWILSSYESDQKTSVSSEASSTSNKCGGKQTTTTTSSLTYETEGSKLDGVTLQAYPNPVLNMVTIRFDSDKVVDDEIMIYDNQGRTHAVNGSWKGFNEVELDMTPFIKGEYLIRVQVDNQYELIRIIKTQ